MMLIWYLLIGFYVVMCIVMTAHQAITIVAFQRVIFDLFNCNVNSLPPFEYSSYYFHVNRKMSIGIL